MDRLAEIFQKCKREERSALIVFASAGYPDAESGEAAMELAIRNGADILEIGVPFSDPMADGPVIAEASQTALRNGIKFKDILEMTARIRKRHPETGLILFSYMNIFLNYGEEKLCRTLKEIGVDGILAVDLPLEERDELKLPCRKNGIHLIPLISPTSGLDRAKQILDGVGGFVYCISVRGITGARSGVPPELAERLADLKQITEIPIAVGFGVANAESAHQIAEFADGVIVGSAFVKACGRDPRKAESLIRSLAAAMKKE